METIVEVPVEQRVEVPTDTAALQLLGLLQREARFVDFIQEDVAPYTDAEISAAAKDVEGKTEMDAVVAYLQGLGKNAPKGG